MLPDRDIAQLCHGRMIKADVYQSSGKDAAGPHWAVMLDSDEEIREHDRYFAAVISHNTTIDPEHVLPVPAYTGLTGFIQCGWVVEIDLAGITDVGPMLLVPDLMKVHQVERAARIKKKGSAKP
jgi:hypothetical protein